MGPGCTLLEQASRTGLVTLTVQQGEPLRSNTPTGSWHVTAHCSRAWLPNSVPPVVTGGHIMFPSPCQH